MSQKIVILLFSYIILVISCNTTEPPPAERTITLTLEDASSIEAWIKLTTTNFQLPATVTLKQNNTVTQDIVLSNADTLLYIDSLLPNQQYIFQAIAQSSNQSITSNELSVTTMDTTSHDFTWQTWELGEHGISILRDVFIIDENNIWAVGEIYMNDSLGNPDPTRYNLAIWDGNDWAIKRVPYYYQGQPFYHPIQGIFAFAYDDIWFCGNGVIHWDGNQFNEVPIPLSVWGPYQMNKIWGTSSEDLYVVGNNGNIAWYNGSVWTKIESGTNIDLLDVWGSPDGSVIWSCGYNQDYANTVLLMSENENWSNIFEGSPFAINNNNNVGLLGSCWTNNNLNTHLVNSEAVLRQRSSAELFLERITDDLSDLTFSIRGNANNDIIVVGQDGLVGHFNGITLLEFEELKINDDNYYAVSINGNSVATAGFRYNNSFFSQALISIGRR